MPLRHGSWLSQRALRWLESGVFDLRFFTRNNSDRAHRFLTMANDRNLTRYMQHHSILNNCNTAMCLNTKDRIDRSLWGMTAVHRLWHRVTAGYCSRSISLSRSGTPQHSKGKIPLEAHYEGLWSHMDNHIHHNRQTTPVYTTPDRTECIPALRTWISSLTWTRHTKSACAAARPHK